MYDTILKIIQDFSTDIIVGNVLQLSQLLLDERFQEENFAEYLIKCSKEKTKPGLYLIGYIETCAIWVYPQFLSEDDGIYLYKHTDREFFEGDTFEPDIDNDLNIVMK